VVDNGPDPETEAVVREVGGDHPGPVRYLPLPGPDLAAARNAGVAAARAPLVAFLDDDEVAAPGWLERMRAVLEDTGADGVLGTVIPRADTGPLPAWADGLDVFGSQQPLATGAPVSHAGIGSALLERGPCLEGPAPFSSAFARSGGEDTELFLRLQARGRRLVWCADPLVEERLEPARLTPEFALWRTYLGHHGWARAAQSASRSPRWTLLRVMGAGFLQAALWILPALATLPSEHPAAVRSRLALAGAIGKLTWFLEPRQAAYPRDG